MGLPARIGWKAAFAGCLSAPSCYKSDAFRPYTRCFYGAVLTGVGRCLLDIAWQVDGFFTGVRQLFSIKFAWERMNRCPAQKNSGASNHSQSLICVAF